jgi:hypothetical protein
MAQDFFSSHAIDDEIEFIPMFFQQQKLGITEDIREGKVVAVRFTKAKVFYDILDEYYGIIFENVDSSKVFSVTAQSYVVGTATP